MTHGRTHTRNTWTLTSSFVRVQQLLVFILICKFLQICLACFNINLSVDLLGEAWPGILNILLFWQVTFQNLHKLPLQLERERERERNVHKIEKHHTCTHAYTIPTHVGQQPSQLLSTSQPVPRPWGDWGALSARLSWRFKRLLVPLLHAELRPQQSDIVSPQGEKKGGEDKGETTPPLLVISAPQN